jgi:23S rRNA pseudouridine2605 synthase
MTAIDKTRRVGLARGLSKLGYCSRSQAMELIHAGRVTLNGTTQRDPETPVHLERDRIEVDCHSVRAESKIYLMLNKPRGVVTTASDEKGRDTVYSFLGAALPWVAPVGRLDKASEGLLLLTNDSEWAARISDPETHLEKTYHVQVGAVVDEIILDEGKNRQIRRMMEAAGVEVLRLVRVAVGPLILGKLAKGGCRALSSDEKRALDQAMKIAKAT